MRSTTDQGRCGEAVLPCPTASNRGRHRARVGGTPPSALVAAVALLAALAPLRTAAAAPATTLADLCPGTPDPCVVSGSFTVADGISFDAGGRAVRLAAGGEIEGAGRFSLVNAATIDLEAGSRLAATPTRSAFFMPCPPNDGLATAPDEPLSVLAGEDPNGIWALTVFNFGGVGAALSAWGLEVCTENGCSLFPSSDVPLAIGPWFDPPNNRVTSEVTVATTGSITRVSVIGFEAAIQHVPLAYLSSPVGTEIKVSGTPDDIAFCTVTEFDLTLADPVPADYQVQLQASGACSLGGAIDLDAPVGGGHAGSLRVACQGVTLAAGLDLSGRGAEGAGAAVAFDAGAGALTTAPGARIDLRGRRSRGGALHATAGGACALDALQFDASSSAGGAPSLGGNGGELGLQCNGITLQGRTSIRLNGAKGAEGSAAGGRARFLAGTGDFESGDGTKLWAKSPTYDVGGTVEVTGTGSCSIGGRFQTQARATVEIGEGGEVFVIRGSGGTLRADCGSIVVPAGAKHKLGSTFDRQATLDLRAATTVEIELGADLRADGVSSYSPLGAAVRIEAADTCTINGRVRSRGSREATDNVVFVCESFALGPKGQVRLGATGGFGGTLIVDTTGVSTGQPPGPCTILGRIDGRSRSLGGDANANGAVVDLDCGTTTTVAEKARIDVSCSGFESEAGAVFLTSGGDALIDGQLVGSGSFSGGSFYLEACDLTLSPTGKITSGGYGRNVVLTAHDALAIQGAVRSVPFGSVALTYRNSISIPGGIAPSPTVTQDGALSPCP